MSLEPPWLMLIVSLTGRNPTPRMRLWRALKAAGAEPLRDGVYVLPTGAKTAPLFQAQADEVTRVGGTAYVVPFAAADEEQDAGLRASFEHGHPIGASMDGDFIMTAEEVQPVLRALRAGGLHVVALHNHMMDESPAYYFTHFWGTGRADDLARAFRGALDAQADVASSGEQE